MLRPPEPDFFLITEKTLPGGGCRKLVFTQCNEYMMVDYEAGKITRIATFYEKDFMRASQVLKEENMPSATCGKCGGLTNSTTSDYWFAPGNKPTKCYAKYVKGTGWVKGCCYDEAEQWEKEWVDSLLAKK